MAATHGEYRGYLRNTVDMEAGQGRFHSVPSSESTYRPLLFGTLAVMGLLQVASSVAILLHLTGYLQEVKISSFFSSTLVTKSVFIYFFSVQATEGFFGSDSLRSRLDHTVESRRPGGIYAILLGHKTPR